MSKELYDSLLAGIAHQNKIEEADEDDHYAATGKPQRVGGNAAEEHGRHRDMQHS